MQENQLYGRVTNYLNSLTSIEESNFTNLVTGKKPNEIVFQLGVGLTDEHEFGFYQVDMRGNLFGMLSAHLLSPLVSLHHLEAVDPIFPNLYSLLCRHAAQLPVR
ncbi:hypothetical protein ACFX1X_004516 [Malus domestica]|uniref:Uncharacterized protein n=1 Tax=Malus domestica TaxID=3750 RepID=A0A498IXE5_MALDO|nr:hypothetical protein DVH24_022057 [Malus domestica]